MKKFTMFLQEHMSFMVFQLFLVMFILFLYWLDGFRTINTAIYSISMSMLLMAGLSCRKIHHETFLLRNDCAQTGKDGGCPDSPWPIA